MTHDRQLQLPPGLSPEEERSTLRALERYFGQESPHPHPWVLAGRMEATGWGALQARRHADSGWPMMRHARFVRPGVPTMTGRGDAR
ncbi:MAG TPA: hypothetical protein VE646_12035 [Actinomycetota bacterium]|jgi:hypothetical protein|nr:hypothetical protein [Actinomycetota bacterium]